MSSQNSWRHHVIPQFYLRAFTNLDHKLYRLEKAHWHGKWLSPRQVGFKPHFHRVPGRTITLEPMLDRQVESVLAPSHQRMQGALRFGEVFPQAERDALNRMVAHQLVRLPHQRTRLQDLIQQVAQARRIPLSAAELEKTTQLQHLRMISSLETRVVRDLTETVASFQVSFLKAGRGLTFWTGDVPLVIGRADPHTGRVQSSLDLPLGQVQTQLYFPLARDLVAVFHHGTLPMPPLRILIAKAPEVEWVNTRILANAHRDVFSAGKIDVDPALQRADARGRPHRP
ncbi:DUF4238 domain-containing protein [Deinococcus aquaticus]|uniref:DUF4238 domain-containing protein n=1 Tax=Deinococcus aquaticus TaxID=328692 RepID=UPI00360AB144